MSWKKMIMGEKMPDKNDPNYHDRYVRDVNAGREFAKATKIDKAAAKIQQFANVHTKTFLVIVFGFIIASFVFNLYHMGQAYSHQQEHPSATEVQEMHLRKRHTKIQRNAGHLHTVSPSVNKDY